MKKLLISMFCVGLFGFSAEAQFLKKLQKKVEAKVEERVTENISNKAAKQAEKSLNKMWDTKLKSSPIPMSGSTVDSEKIPDIYNFTWAYEMQVETTQGNMNMIYYLKEEAPYFAISMKESGDMHMVMDTENEFTVMYFSSKGNKFINAYSLDLDDLEENDDEDFYKNWEIEEIEGKNILGYNCKGFKAENKESKMKFYMTDETSVTFTGMQTAKNSKIPKGFTADWLRDGKGLIMEMQMENHNKPEENATMKCISLKQENFSLKKADYNQ